MRKFSYQFQKYKIDEKFNPYIQNECDFDEMKRQSDQYLGQLIASDFEYELIPIYKDNVDTFFKEIYCLTHYEVVELKHNIELIDLNFPNNPFAEKIKNILKIE